MELTNENYHSIEASMEYMGSSQFKNFMKCEAEALARCKGEYKEEKTKALLMGSYIDAYFSNEMNEFIANTPELFTKNGVLKSEFSQCDEIIDFIKKDDKFSKYLNGEHQVIMTGVIAGVKFKIKIDSYFPGKAIVDQKIVKDFEPIWDEKEHCKKNWVDFWGYTIQGAIYREVVRQNTGLTLPFILAVATKEKVPNKALIQIDDDVLDETLELVKELAPKFDAIKKGEVEPKSCEVCDYCKSKKMVSGIKSYHIFDPYEDEF